MVSEVKVMIGDESNNTEELILSEADISHSHTKFSVIKRGLLGGLRGSMEIMLLKLSATRPASRSSYSRAVSS